MKPMPRQIEDFLTYLSAELNYSPLTVEAYSRDIRSLAGYVTGGKEMEFDPVSIESGDIRAWVGQLARAGQSRRTLRRKLQSVRALYRYLMLVGKTDRNPAMDLAIAKPHDGLPSFIREEETNNLFDKEYDCGNFIEVRDRLILLLLYSTGMRRAEIVGLLDRNIDLNRRELKVLGKRNKERVIPFGDELAEMIALYRELREENGLTETEQLLVRPGGPGALSGGDQQHSEEPAPARGQCNEGVATCVAPLVCNRHAQQRSRHQRGAAVAGPRIISHDTDIHPYINPRTTTKLQTRTPPCTKKVKEDHHGNSHSSHPFRHLGPADRVYQPQSRPPRPPQSGNLAHRFHP